MAVQATALPVRHDCGTERAKKDLGAVLRKVASFALTLVVLWKASEVDLSVQTIFWGAELYPLDMLLILFPGNACSPFLSMGVGRALDWQGFAAANQVCGRHFPRLVTSRDPVLSATASVVVRGHARNG
eukprot:3406368-Amphidinium_carterae.1